jgi:hypothetical protein
LEINPTIPASGILFSLDNWIWTKDGENGWIGE